MFDPQATGCHDCPTNLVLVRADDGLFRTFNLYGLRIAIAWIAACGVLLVWRLVRSRRVAPILLPVIVPALAYLGLVAWDFQHSLARGILSNDAFDQSLWRYEAVALVALALGIAWGLVRERRARAAVAHLVVELGRAPEPGTVRAALAATLDDRRLELAYRRSGAAAYVDAAGRPLELDPGLDRAVTPILRNGRPVAALVHDARFVDQPGLLQEVLSAARVAVENERLQAEVRAQVEELQSSRARIVEAGDAERRRLERDLHDGAQQRLLALSYDLRVARWKADAEGDKTVGDARHGCHGGSAGGGRRAPRARPRDLSRDPRRGRLGARIGDACR